jgi:diguanylate cyclase (GGDEF)-like protein
VSDPGGNADVAGAGAEATLHAAFDRLMPFHVLVGPDGHIERCGPTLDRLAGPGRLQGRAFLSAFDLRRPRDAFTFAALRQTGGAPLRLVLREGIHPPMRGLTVPLPDGRTLVNLSFGIAMVEAVARYRLTADDFAPTDLAVEMLYLVEAQSAALHESRKLNGRLQGAKIAAEEQAFTDTLTGLKNRRAMTHVMERLLASQSGFGLMLLDLDFFKDVNDTLGHAAGDLVLQTVARILLDEARPGDTVVRLGGDEFALIAPGLSDRDAALALARRIVQRIEVPIPVGTERCRVSASIGIVLSAALPGAGIADLLTQADAMLYAVKGAGRGDARVASPAMPASEARIAGEATDDTVTAPPMAPPAGPHADATPTAVGRSGPRTTADRRSA